MLTILNLRTEYKINPLGLESSSPRLSWEIRSTKRNVFQTSWQVRCAASAEALNDADQIIWDSGKVESDQSVHVKYKGNPLGSGQRVYWQVRVWDNKGEESGWSPVAFWEMGLLLKSDWKATWIEPGFDEDVRVSTPCPYLRKEFTTGQQVVRASVYITARGLYELSLNGKNASPDLFTPGWTSYHNRLQYQVYDVTGQVRSGKNAIGVVLGDGWYCGYLGWEGKKSRYGEKLALLFMLKLSYANGTEEYICSDKSWKCSSGPILKSDIYNGETYDARLEQTGWNCPDFDDTCWSPVFDRNYPFDNIVASVGVPVRITGRLTPVKRIVTPAGELVFDLGQNMVGWVRFRLKGKAGSRIRLNHAEVLDQEGNFYTANLRQAKAEDIYIFRGEEIETFAPHFTFHGFRYIRVNDYEGDISINDIEGCVIHSDMSPTGDFECSDPLVNQLQKNIQWGLRGNFLDVPTDCPQRDERLGWTGDAQVFAPTACFNRDAANFYTKWMKDFIADQRNDGSVPWVVPNVVENGGGTGWSDGFGATGWADAAVIIPWTVYQAYGDEQILAGQYGSMKAWEEYMIRESGDSFIFDSVFHFGDWLSFSEYYSYNYNAPDYGYAGAHTDKDLIATAYFYHTTDLMVRIATVLKKDEDAERYALILPKIRDAFHREFVTCTGRLTSNTQTAYVLALSFGLLTGDAKESAIRRLVNDVNYFGHLTTGFLGTPLICQALTENGYPEIAYKLLFNKRYPSWLYPVTRGATTIWERWDCIKPDGSFQDVGMNSFNHYAYGAVGNWLYSCVAGLKTDPQNPGYRRFLIKPYLTDKLTYAKAEYHSLYGDILSHWELQKGSLVVNVKVPVNTSALVYLPATEDSDITESDKPLSVSEGIKWLGNSKGRIILKAGSGTYRFKVEN